MSDYEELVKRCKAMRDYNGIITREVSQEVFDCVTEAADAIEKLTNVGERYGQWLDADGQIVSLDESGHPIDSVWCSKCGDWLVASDEYYVRGRYCPNCGARMDGVIDR